MSPEQSPLPFEAEKPSTSPQEENDSESRWTRYTSEPNAGTLRYLDEIGGGLPADSATEELPIVKVQNPVSGKSDGIGRGDRLVHDHHMPDDPWNHPELPANPQEEADKAAGIVYVQKNAVDEINWRIALKKAGDDEHLARLFYDNDKLLRERRRGSHGA